MNMDKKSLGLVAAAILAALSGGAEVLSLGDRVEALEALHPELVTDAPTGSAPEEPEAEPKTEEPEAEEPEAEESSSSADPAPGEDHLELNEDDEWVAADLDAALEEAEE